MKISVIVPIYNMEKFISRAIQCLKIQDEQNIEFLLINDGSKDRRFPLCESSLLEIHVFRYLIWKTRDMDMPVTLVSSKPQENFLPSLSQMIV